MFKNLAHNFKLTPSAAIIHKIFETNSSINVKYRTMGKVHVLLFRKIFTSTEKILAVGGGLSTR